MPEKPADDEVDRKIEKKKATKKQIFVTPMDAEGNVHFLPGMYYLYDGRIVLLTGVEGPECELHDVASHEPLKARVDLLAPLPRSKSKKGYPQLDLVPTAEFIRAKRLQVAIKEISEFEAGGLSIATAGSSSVSISPSTRLRC